MTSAMMVSLLSNKSAHAHIDLPEYCSLQGDLVVNGIELLPSSGNVELDNSVKFELASLSESLKVFPAFGFYDDKEGPNALATQQTVLDDTDGTVLFGIQLLSECLARHPKGDIAVAGIMGHEFGHIYQYKTKLSNFLRYGQPTHKLLELHADYLAGYYMGLKRLRSDDFDIKAYVDSVYLSGDTDFTSPGHHGSPAERKSVMLEGYKIGLTNNADIQQVADMGVELVKNS
jgi:hypothetical protein